MTDKPTTETPMSIPAAKAPKALSEDAKPALHGQKFQELDASTAAMLESQEVPAIQGSDDEWWCPNPTCEIIDK
ncbi:MAG: hypothetical protein JG774_1845 [Desulfomicrobiaceae bacterium]|jgi:hypothetical protein|nr:hypothetical protein [Desulfomicrobiaceae bacterium]MBZ4686100.1 hypothetical protein [Desulfomicrobiaceae bacterium]MDI3493806.1 hypothetical protein [Desulfomicrobiaceae bacterium]MDK2873797.1 hypothetical protein [Desulfomicrobiaceae bacterium]HCF05194.1 hypothetical protein [Desulfomicrobiaceae bacterium]